MIGIIDYGSGNIHAIGNIYKNLKIDFAISSDPAVLAKADKLILPGVGAFDKTMERINQSGMREVIDEKVMKDKTPILGVCVGMQVMAKSSEEGSLAGFGWIDGVVRKFDASQIETVPKLPHMGWNTVHPVKHSDLFKNMDERCEFYFLHSFYFECHDENSILAETVYSHKFACAVNRGNVYGAQFHPEKSHHNGINLLKNFAELVC